ncbi:DUF86 domain-containing protein [Salibacterium aidingense]|uniref:DUF86 domain-containing protein n=1 Tax=Salibacterium aidingense TaxID=384933 RepID=UPI000419CFA3|nr:DUF86 domain-containing protein [Salibacterium aidingense]
MYFVDRRKIEQILRYMEELTAVFPYVSEGKTKMDELAAERIAQGWIEAVTDTGNQLIDGFIMRDPGSYEDIMDILEDEKVISEEEGAGLKQIISFRRMLVQDYYLMDTSNLCAVMLQHKKAMEHFPERVRSFLENELGPVSAFLPEEEK